MTFQTFTGREYLKIDIANNFGHDKLDWDDRIIWFDNNDHRLDALVSHAEEPALFYAAIQAWKHAAQGKPSGYPISLDATCSGIQILACLAGDRKAAEITNVVDTGHRKDAYTSIYVDMANKVGEKAKISRAMTKDAIMTAFYGSTARPKHVFGDGVLLDMFYSTMEDQAPGAWEITQTMLAIWDPNALINEWVLPDNYHVKVKVMGQVKENVHFLNEPFEVTYFQNQPIKGGRSLGANMVHSIDGMMVREMQRRCNYDPSNIKALRQLLACGARGRSTHKDEDKKVIQLWEHYTDSGFLSARILDYLTIDNIGMVNSVVIQNLIDSLPLKPFEVISIHDCFRCLPNYGNDLRRQYNNLLAEIAESTLLSFIVSQMCHRHVPIIKMDISLGKDIRNANYALS